MIESFANKNLCSEAEVNDIGKTIKVTDKPEDGAITFDFSFNRLPVPALKPLVENEELDNY